MSISTKSLKVMIKSIYLVNYKNTNINKYVYLQTENFYFKNFGL